ncbi:MAG: lysophospholipase [Candidatus Obscuribacterales bacterium]|nr:lysophospholipase [Candidatus Obscuribacterales bacterium]
MINDIQLDPSCAFLDIPLQGESVRFRQWGALQGSRAVILLVHGLGAHGAWFEGAARELMKRGYLVLAYDQRGFGDRASLPVNSYNEWIGDLAAIVKHFRQAFNQLPLYLLGNSMGALVVMGASKGLDVDGIVICSPGFDGHPQAFSTAYKINAIFSALFAPNRIVNLPYNLDRVTRVEAVRRFIINDQFKKMAVPGSMLLQLLKLSRSVLASLKQVHVPVLMITAGQEKVVDNVVNLKVFERLAAPSKKHIEMTEAWHDLMFDPLVDEVADEISTWQSSLAKNHSMAVPK